ncbi:MAG: lysophospholipid acyltransferase family protein [Bryobacteraceae bacterium]
MGQRSFLRNALEYGAAASVVASLRYAPLPVARGLAHGYARLLDLAVPRLRRVAMRNLALAIPERTESERGRIADGVFDSIARLFLCFAKFPQIGRDSLSRWVRFDGYEHYERARQQGRGVLLATAHLGNWELGALAHALEGDPMDVVVRPLDNPWIDRLVARRRAACGNRVIEKRDAARAIFKALAANRTVGILMDQNSSLDQGVFVDFFGVPACTGTGFARIAARSGAAVIPAFALWSEEEERHVVRYYPPVEMTDSAEEDTARLQKRLETIVREVPDQWLWIHRRWKTRPPGEGPIY